MFYNVVNFLNDQTIAYSIRDGFAAGLVDGFDKNDYDDPVPLAYALGYRGPDATCFVNAFNGGYAQMMCVPALASDEDKAITVAYVLGIETPDVIDLISRCANIHKAYKMIGDTIYLYIPENAREWCKNVYHALAPLQ